MATISINESEEKAVHFALSIEEAGILMSGLARFAAGTPVMQALFDELDDAGVSAYSNVRVQARAVDPVLELRLDETPEDGVQSE